MSTGVIIAIVVVVLILLALLVMLPRMRAKSQERKAQRELGWRPTPLDEGVRRTLNAMGLLESS